MAQLTTSELIRLLEQIELRAMTDRSVTQRSYLRDELSMIRTEGYCEEIGQCYSLTT